MSDFLERYDADQKRKERIPEPTRHVEHWVRDDGNTSESRLVAIVYPRDSYYVIDRLTEDGWVYGDPFGPKNQDTEERAIAQAQSAANKTGQPHAVREVLPD